MKEIEKKSHYITVVDGKSTGLLSKAFQKFRDDEKLNADEKDAITKLTDEFITCSLNPDTVHETKDVGKRIVEIAKEVNCHHCTKKCDTNCDNCKYGFPRFPLKQTIVIDRNEFNDKPDNDDIDEKGKKSTTIVRFFLMWKMYSKIKKL